MVPSSILVLESVACLIKKRANVEPSRLVYLGPAYVFKTCSTNLDCILVESHDRIVILTTFVYKLIDCIIVEPVQPI
jgi:hypothetical protein